MMGSYFIDWTSLVAIIPVSVGLLATVIGIFTAWRKWRDSELTRCRVDIKDLKKDNATLTREALIRIDDLQDQYRQIDDLHRQIDDLQTRVVEQRKRRQEFIEGDKDN